MVMLSENGDAAASGRLARHAAAGYGSNARPQERVEHKPNLRTKCRINQRPCAQVTFSPTNRQQRLQSLSGLRGFCQAGTCRMAVQSLPSPLARVFAVPARPLVGQPGAEPGSGAVLLAEGYL